MKQSNFDYDKICFHDFVERIETLGGTFKGEIRWTTNINLSDWKIHYLQITPEGSLIHSIDKKNTYYGKVAKVASSSLTNYDGLPNSTLLKHAVIRHLAGCNIRILNNKGNTNIVRVSEYSENSKAIYLNITNQELFFELFCALTWWSALKPIGIFNKITLDKKIISTKLNDLNDLSNLLLCSTKLNIFAPIPKDYDTIDTISDLRKPVMFQPEISKDNWQWYLVSANLYSNGNLDLLDEKNHIVLLSIDMKKLLRSEIRLLDFSLFENDNSIFIGILRQLREEMNLNNNPTKIFNKYSIDEQPENIILNFSNKAELNDWFVILKSFAIVEILGLSGADKSNELRISNRFKISIVEADFTALDLLTEDRTCSLYAEISIWDKVWTKTPMITNSQVPFWREEFSFNEEVEIKKLDINLFEEVENNGVITKSLLGKFTLDQEALNNTDFAKETRVPIYSESHEHSQVATLCFKIDAKLEFVLSSVNFSKFETVFLSLNYSDLASLLYKNINILTQGGRLDQLSMICLEVFQSMGKIEPWFQAIMDKEFADIDEVILRNTNNDKTSAHIFNTLFRGNSLLSKTTEAYFFKVGYEYIEISIAPILREIINSNESCELDPAQIKLQDDEKSKVIDENFERLISWVNKIWSKIYETSNDLPIEVKVHLKICRKELEKFCLKDNEAATLNCISGFLFLRFFCPIILNPKLFNFTLYHLNDNNRRTLTLICKILLNLSTLKNFGDKEPFMARVNEFINAKREDLLNYIDKVTEKQLDFTPKVLDSENKYKSVLSKLPVNQKELKELPSNPYLIDKSLRETEFVKILNRLNFNTIGDNGSTSANSSLPLKSNSLDSGTDAIGELEFENIAENNIDIFGDEFMQYLEVDENDEERFIPDKDGKYDNESQLSTERIDLIQQFLQEISLVCFKIDRIIKLMTHYESSVDNMIKNKDYAVKLAKSIYFSNNRDIIIDRNDLFDEESGLVQLFAGSNKSSICNAGLFQFEHIESNSSQDDRNDFYMGNPESASTRTLSRFTSLIKGGSSSDGKVDSQNGSNRSSPSKLSRWFKKSKD